MAAFWLSPCSAPYRHLPGPETAKKNHKILTMFQKFSALFLAILFVSIRIRFVAIPTRSETYSELKIVRSKPRLQFDKEFLCVFPVSIRALGRRHHEERPKVPNGDC